MEKIVIDTCVLYTHLHRDILLSIAYEDFYQLVVSEEILDELGRSVSKRLGKNRSEKLLQRFNDYFGDAIIKRNLYKPCLQSLTQINKKDQHVAALALYVWPSKILTIDKDFQRELLNEGIPYSEPDDFICNIISTFGKNSIPAIKLVKYLHERTLGEQIDAEKFIDMLKVNELTKTAAILKQYASLL